MKVSTSTVLDNGSSILLMLEPSEELLSEQARIVSLLPEQVPVKELHVTLMRSAGSAKAFPSPPPFVEFDNEACLVTDGSKTSVYLRATEASQSALADYVASIEELLGVDGLQNKARIFHVSLSNRAGPPGESVANVWEYQAIPVR
ncbi:hypothetical protein Q8A64_10170 [Oxalobacteraceae bacterium R-40]|uniref:2'-5' RNA ligase superfamily protein n=1 Tax=Keguizhuia sedimenti TaxID=3064264 RepID=A0ABU1BPG8_9BURK|nr:hypothetical protein [Oxalobacteraceae bacterium R-40]